MNYQEELETIINTLTDTPKLLLHSCCAPCSSYVIEYLSQFFDITIYYYNPNIFPEEEYNRRKQEQITFIEQFKGQHAVNYIDVDYEPEKFSQLAEGLEDEKEGGSRCHKCYYLRLEKTCQKAKELQYDFFGTTLTVSPYKNSKIINEHGKELEKDYEINYLFSDFKKKNGYKRSIELSKQYDLYRQDYCGCIYSKKAREEYEKKETCTVNAK